MKGLKWKRRNRQKENIGYSNYFRNKKKKHSTIWYKKWKQPFGSRFYVKFNSSIQYDREEGAASASYSFSSSDKFSKIQTFIKLVFSLSFCFKSDMFLFNVWDSIEKVNLDALWLSLWKTLIFELNDNWRYLTISGDKNIYAWARKLWPKKYCQMSSFIALWNRN